MRGGWCRSLHLGCFMRYVTGCQESLSWVELWSACCRKLLKLVTVKLVKQISYSNLNGIHLHHQLTFKKTLCKLPLHNKLICNDIEVNVSNCWHTIKNIKHLFPFGSHTHTYSMLNMNCKYICFPWVMLVVQILLSYLYHYKFLGKSYIMV